MSPAPAATAATPAAATPAATHAAATATTATADPSHLLEPGDAVLLVEQMERGKTDVRHLFVAENEPLPGPGHVIVRLRDIGCGQRRCERAPCQRKSKSSGTERRRGSGFGRASPSCSLLYPCHGRFPRYVTGFRLRCGRTRTAYECEAAQAVPICENFFFDTASGCAVGASLEATDHLGMVFL